MRNSKRHLIGSRGLNEVLEMGLFAISGNDNDEELSNRRFDNSSSLSFPEMPKSPISRTSFNPREPIKCRFEFLIHHFTIISPSSPARRRVISFSKVRNIKF
ncbi:hypothetical protein CEXT_391501 [Caerostris extrusa]|uniref:Uncharacterized protein n=1 Tax=Caerostris extrusa TaxID=172846 RepID=A0AAV4W1I5_CAEEX|nr:hypothetical protein CEXT_391501 [Caerostris extrusa]